MYKFTALVALGFATQTAAIQNHSFLKEGIRENMLAQTRTSDYGSVSYILTLSLTLGLLLRNQNLQLPAKSNQGGVLKQKMKKSRR
jgi:hypothetical protein